MPILEGAIILFVLVVVSNIISHYIVSIPTALIQIALGLVVAVVFGTQIELETSWFMLLFVAPLLYNDGRHYPKRDLWNLRIPIFGNSILLVFLTTLIGGYIMYFVTGGKMPLAAAFALAAILSPTDPVAVNGIAEQVKLPTGVLRLVRGESLVNDASGLIAFKYAIAATVTGVFSLKAATIDFFYMAIVGCILGILLELLIFALKEWLSMQGIKDVVLHTLIQILTPFIIYIIVEEVFHASGVIAVVAAGVVANNKRALTENRMAEVRIVTERTWDVIIYLLNGMMFLILGIELPFAMSTALENKALPNYVLFSYVLLLWLVILICRIVWTYSYMWFGYSFGKSKSEVQPNFKIALMSGLTGVRGAVTMAGILSVPYLLDSGDAFPQRSVMLFVASGVIVATLIAATIALPLLTNSKRRFETSGDELIDFPEGSVLDDPKEDELKEAQARIRIMQIAIRTIEQESRPENRMASYDLIHEYNHMIRRLQMEYNTKESITKFLKEEVDVRLLAFDAEVNKINEMRESGEVEKAVADQYLAVLARRRNALNSDWSSRFNRLRIFARRFYRRNLKMLMSLRKKEAYQKEYHKRLALEKEAAKSAIQELSRFMKKDKKADKVDKTIAYHLIVEYRNKIERIKRYGEDYAEEYDQQLQELRLKALNAERTDIQKMFEHGDISRELAIQLRRFVNYTESSVIDINDEE